MSCPRHSHPGPAGLPAHRLSRGVAGLLLALACLPAAARVDSGREGELHRLVREECGACHGLTLRGGLGSPLTAGALRDKPDALLTTTILDGRYGTAMPPWRAFLSAGEAQWIVDRLRVDGFAGEHP